MWKERNSLKNNTSVKLYSKDMREEEIQREWVQLSHARYIVILFGSWPLKILLTAPCCKLPVQSSWSIMVHFQVALTDLFLEVAKRQEIVL